MINCDKTEYINKTNNVRKFLMKRLGIQVNFKLIALEGAEQEDYVI